MYKYSKYVQKYTFERISNLIVGIIFIFASLFNTLSEQVADVSGFTEIYNNKNIA
jgi:hypothetical protein